MMGDILAIICIAYTFLLFVVAYLADRVARQKTRAFWLGSPLIYTLSLSVYCTAWTFYGAIGSAARSGLEFLAIYIGPSLVFFSFWLILRRIVAIGHRQNITSIADFISSRFGKSNALAVVVTLLCFIATTPYISLQLQSITGSFALFYPDIDRRFQMGGLALISTITLSLFAILFGTRHARVNERHYGVVVAIALESVVKLASMLIVGGFLIYQFGGFAKVFATSEAQLLIDRPIFTARWFALVSLSFMAVLVLPRMFHVIVVENENESDLFTASWAFPLYLLALNIFVFPIAVIGANLMGPNANPDYFLISLPLHMNATALAYLAVIGGLSAATSMIIVSAIAVATMVSNHIAAPIWLDARGNLQNPEDVSRALLRVRRIAIVFIIFMGYAYYEIAGANTALASIGLIAFVGVAQIFPSLIAAILWQSATRLGAMLGILLGSAIWLYTLYIPSLESSILDPWTNVSEGVWALLNPHALLGVTIGDPVVHALFWSMIVNIAALFIGSIVSVPRSLERLQANQFLELSERQDEQPGLERETDLRVEDYLVLSQRVLGLEETTALFRKIATAQGRAGEFPLVNSYFLDRLERELGAVLGGAAAHALIRQLAGSGALPVSDTIKLADETVQTLEYARALEAQSRELESTAKALQEANASLIALDAQKDAFLSQVSHELRTPMSAIRSFTDLLRHDEDLTEAQRSKMLEIIAVENARLTSLLDELLDLSYLESGQVRMARDLHNIRDILIRALRATEPVWQKAGLGVEFDVEERAYNTLCDENRVLQIFINLITNAAKYVQGVEPKLHISIRGRGAFWAIDFVDNGPGIPKSARNSIFEKFSRGSAKDVAGSAGLGLAISREIAENLGGALVLVPSNKGSVFRLSLLKADSTDLSE